MHAFDQNVGNVSKVRHIRLFEFDIVVVVGQFATIRTDNPHAGGEIIFCAERGQRRRVVDRIKTHHQEVIARVDRRTRWEIKVHRIAQMPHIRRIVRMVERDRGRGNIVELDELVLHVVVHAIVERVIHDLADHDRSDARIRVGPARAHAEFFHTAGVVSAECACAHGDKFLARIACNVTTERNAVFGRAEVDAGAEPGEQPVRTDREHDFIPLRAKRKGNSRFVAIREMSFVDHDKAIRWQDGRRRNLIFLKSSLVVAQPPAANIDRLRGQIAQFDRVFERQIRVRERLVDHYRREQPII